MLLPLLLPFLPLTLADSTCRLLHRVYHPSAPDLPFTDRATLSINGSGPRTSPSLAPSETLSSDYYQFAQSLETVGLDGALYQVALEHPGDEDQSKWHISSVKACHFPQSTSESFSLHLAADGTPFAIDYFLAPIPHDGSCPTKPRALKSSSKALEFNHITNSTILVRSPRFPPLPILHAPPPLTQEGKPVEPVPEKTFLQKYWIYILVAVAALVFSPAAPEEEGGAGGRQGGGRR